MAATDRKTRTSTAQRSDERELRRLVRKLGIIGWHGMAKGSVKEHVRNLRLIEQDMDKGRKQSTTLIRGRSGKQRD